MEISGGSGYRQRPVIWTTVESEYTAIDAWERAEAEEVVKVLRRFARLFEDEPED